jgi:hypothetical protein
MPPDLPEPAPLTMDVSELGARFIARPSAPWVLMGLLEALPVESVEPLPMAPLLVVELLPELGVVVAPVVPVVPLEDVLPEPVVPLDGVPLEVLPLP